jgi:hypothetical protein
MLSMGLDRGEKSFDRFMTGHSTNPRRVSPGKTMLVEPINSSLALSGFAILRMTSHVGLRTKSPSI